MLMCGVTRFSGFLQKDDVDTEFGILAMTPKVQNSKKVSSLGRRLGNRYILLSRSPLLPSLPFKAVALF